MDSDEEDEKRDEVAIDILMPKSPPKTIELINMRRSTARNIPNANKIQKEEIHKNLQVYFGHENWNLVLNMMIGVRAMVKKIFALKNREEDIEREFRSKWKHNLMKVRVSGLDYKKACIFHDYSTLVFEKIRLKFQISNEAYLRSIGPEFLVVLCSKKLFFIKAGKGSIIMGNLVSLTELISSGKSGSFFYFTGDCNFPFFE